MSRFHTIVVPLTAAIWTLGLAAADAQQGGRSGVKRETPVASHARVGSRDSQTHGNALPIQVMLDRAGFSPGEIDGASGPNTVKALMAYEDDTGESIAPATEATVLTDYTVTAADLGGPFTPAIPADLMAQSELDALNYRTPLEALGERFHSAPALIARLNPGLQLTEGVRLRVPDVAARESNGAVREVRVIVSGEAGSLQVRDATGRTVMFAPVTSGSDHDPLPIGEWHVTAIQHNPVFHYNPALFWDADPSHSKAIIPAGPNGPVGTVWISLDKEHYGLHGTPEPSAIGRTTSHGCVRLTNWDAERLASLVQKGTVVVFQP